MLDLFRRGEVLPEGRTNEEEAALVKKEARKVAETKVGGDLGAVN